MKLLVMVNHNGHGRVWSAHLIELGERTQDLEVPLDTCLRDGSFTEFVEREAAKLNLVPMEVASVGLVHVFQLSPPSKR